METANKRARNILIIDDDEFNSKAVGIRLQRRGFSVEVVSDQASILDVIEISKIELILLDIVMPTIDGLEMLKKIRTKYSKNDIPIIMATAINDTFDIVSAFKDGANDYITKPINIDVAQARINAQLSFIDLYKIESAQKELEAIAALITTYNHEINNPIATALLSLDAVRRNSKHLDIENLAQAESSIRRIEEIVRKITEISECKKILFNTYIGTLKKIKLSV